MADKPVHNLIVVMIAPDHSQIMHNLTISEPGALRLKTRLAGIGPASAPQEVKAALVQGFAEIDQVTVNEPTPPVELPASPPDHDPPEGNGIPAGAADFQAFRDNLLADLADGKIYVARNETGEPVIMEGPHPGMGDGRDTDIMEHPGTIGDGSSDPSHLVDDPAADGSVAGEKHSEGQSQG